MEVEAAVNTPAEFVTMPTAQRVRGADVNAPTIPEPDPWVDQDEPAPRKPKKKHVYTLQTVTRDRSGLRVCCVNQDGVQISMDLLPSYDPDRCTHSMAHAMVRVVGDRLADKVVPVAARNRLDVVEAMYQLINVILETDDELYVKFREQWLPIKAQFEQEADRTDGE